MIRWKRSWPELSEDLPLDVLPCSNGEFLPPPPTREQKAVMALQNEGIEYWRRKFNMNRRDFVRTAAAMAIGFWALDTVQGVKWAKADGTATTDACDLEFDHVLASGDFWLGNKPGEVIFDVQSHHVESDGMWRVTNPGFEAFFTAIWSQAGGVTNSPNDNYAVDPATGRVRGRGGGELDPIENLSRYHYLKELFLDSATTLTVLSAVPAAPDITQPLPMDRAALTAAMVNDLAGSPRTVLHAFVMPNRGSAGSVASVAGREPVYMKREFEIMEERAAAWGGLIRGWKTYPAWGDIPYASGWFFDDELVGQPFIRKVAEIAQRYNMPANIATHKGFALPAFDQRAASPRDIGPAARRNPDVNFIVYHSGFDNEAMTAYKGDDAVSSADRTVDSLIKSLRENGWDATAFGAIPGVKFANVPNVFAEIGSTWRSCMGQLGSVNGTASALAAVHLLGKLITYVGPKRIAWGTDSLWFGSPQSEIVGLRRLSYDHGYPRNAQGQITGPNVWDSYGLPFGIDGDADDPSKDTRDWTNYLSGPAGWPTDGKPHPERSIRSWIFARGAGEVYKVPIDAHMNDRAHLVLTGEHGETVEERPPYNDPNLAAHPSGMRCDDVQKIRDAYVLNQMTPKEHVPLASNTLVGPRNPRELWKLREGPWAP